MSVTAPLAIARPTLPQTAAKATRVNGLPPRLRVLFITSANGTGRWLPEAFAAESGVDVELEEANGAAAGLARLREDLFDMVLISHEPGELDALAFLHALRTGGAEEPVIVLGARSEQEMTAGSFEAGADAYVCVNAVTTRSLIHLAARAIERHRLLRENRRLAQGERQRLAREHQEARHLLDELSGILSALQGLQPPRRQAAAEADERAGLPPELFAHYRELLRAYVIMGSGNLTDEVFALAELLTSAGVTARQALKLHVSVLDESVAGLGNRSSRHVMTRADLLVLELMTHLAEGYHQRYREQQMPPRQMWLPGLCGAENRERSAESQTE